MAQQKVERVVVSRVDAVWIHGRGHSAELPNLRASKVAIIGCGAVGSEVAELLAKAGVGELTLIDNDDLYAGNVGRHLLSEDGDAPTIAMASRLALDGLLGRVPNWRDRSRNLHQDQRHAPIPVVSFLRPNPLQRWAVDGQLDGIGQRLQISLEAFAHVSGCRQTSTRATEAGGQLFGTLTPELISVTKATGPYARDERSRYRSDPAAAQRAIRQQSDAGLLYLGEWHSHAEDCPGSSGLDDDAMRLIIQRSQLNSNALLMLIVGRVETTSGLALFSVAPERVFRWNLGS